MRLIPALLALLAGVLLLSGGAESHPGECEVVIVANDVLFPEEVPA